MASHAVDDWSRGDIRTRKAPEKMIGVADGPKMRFQPYF